MSQERRDAKAEARAAKARSKSLRPWYRKKRWWLLGVIVLIVVIVVGANAGGGTKVTTTAQSGTPASSPPSSPPSSATTAAATFGVGSTQHLSGVLGNDKVDVTLAKVVDPATAATSFGGAAAGKRLVAIQLALHNVGSTTYQTSFLLATKVADQSGQLYDVGLGSDTSAGPGFPGDAVALLPAGHASGWLTFEVPTASHLTSFHFTLDPGANPAVWHLG